MTAYSQLEMKAVSELSMLDSAPSMFSGEPACCTAKGHLAGAEGRFGLPASQTFLTQDGCREQQS